MAPQWLTSVLPVVGAVLGFAAGLFSPMVSGRLSRNDRRRDDERSRCDDILSMFLDVNVLDTLKHPQSTVRRRLLLTAVRIRDTQARDACTSLVEFSSRSDATDEGILDRWTHMVREIARAHRENS